MIVRWRDSKLQDHFGMHQKMQRRFRRLNAHNPEYIGANIDHVSRIFALDSGPKYEQGKTRGKFVRNIATSVLTIEHRTHHVKGRKQITRMGAEVNSNIPEVDVVYE